jgi:hypothetical protein
VCTVFWFDFYLAQAKPARKIKSHSHSTSFQIGILHLDFVHFYRFEITLTVSADVASGLSVPNKNKIKSQYILLHCVAITNVKGDPFSRAYPCF